ncbi:MAG: tripartite tricarboxylate transporter substrate binding protein [Alphaproteobacteria bacterium]|nr:tripartite tricarboxylate transporter substrate binding protein [Alphaproteobacteria bacterium]
MDFERRGFLGAGLAALAMSARSVPATAQAFPSKPVRWIVPFAAGGNYDVTARLVGEPMSRHLGQSVVIDNRPGAGGLVGVEVAASAPADGYTVVMASFSVLYIGPLMARKASLIPAFVPLSFLTTVPMVVVTGAGSRFADWRAVAAEARAKPGTVSVGHAGNGTTNHIGILRIQLNEKLSFNIIPYKGSGPGLVDLMGGQIDCYVDQLTTSLPHIKSGKLRPLVALSLERLPELPDVPTLMDLGGTGFDGGTTAGLFARVETPKPIVTTLNAAVVAALNDATVRQRLGELGAKVRPSTSEAFAAYLKAEEANVVELTKTGLLKPE